LSAEGLGFLIEEDFEAGDKMLLHRVSFWYRNTGGNENERLELRNTHDSGTETEDMPWTVTYEFIERSFDPPLESTFGSLYLVKLTAHIGSAWDVRLDNVTLDFDVEFA
jgi:hypothetical protein